jgi:hypothetical protein
MAMERAPRNPLPKDYAPSQVWYKVTNKDDWSTVARKYGFEAQTLIYFNFRTHNTDEVNWYLRRNVGCNVSRDGGRNWAFSDSANPGKIYIPASKVDFDAEDASREPSGQNKLAKMLDDMPEDSEGWEHVGRTLELFEFAHLGAEAFGIGIGAESVAAAGGATGALGLAAAVAAPLAGAAAVAIALGSPYKAQVDLYKKKAWLWGLGQGAVLGANRNVHAGWVKANFVANFPANVKSLINIPGQEDQFGEVLQSYYDGMGKGLTYGRALNSKEAARLYRVLSEEVNPSTIDYVGSLQYYLQYGAAFRIKFLPAA